MNGHHLILGELTDCLTGETIPDTHDERYRQKIAKLLLEKRGYAKTEIQARCDLQVQADEKCAIIKVDFKIALNGRIYMIVKYGPGSIVTRRRPALAAARLLSPTQIPVVVVTNGEAAEILDGSTGEIIAHGLEAIPSKTEILNKVSEDAFTLIAPPRFEVESRILYAFEVDGSCLCDDNICRL